MEIRMFQCLKNNMRLLKQSKRHILLFELAYKLIAVAVFYPVITGVIRLCMKISGINYITNEKSNIFSFASSDGNYCIC